MQKYHIKLSVPHLFFQWAKFHLNRRGNLLTRVLQTGTNASSQSIFILKKQYLLILLVYDNTMNNAVAQKPSPRKNSPVSMTEWHQVTPDSWLFYRLPHRTNIFVSNMLGETVPSVKNKAHSIFKFLQTKLTSTIKIFRSTCWSLICHEQLQHKCCFYRWWMY